MGIEESLSKIIEMLNELNLKVDLIEALIKQGGFKSAAAQGNDTVSASASSTGGVASVASYVNEQNKSIPESGGRAQCPKCNSIKIIEREDKTKPISYSGGITIYGKKKYCQQCGFSW